MTIAGEKPAAIPAVPPTPQDAMPQATAMPAGAYIGIADGSPLTLVLVPDSTNLAANIPLGTAAGSLPSFKIDPSLLAKLPPPLSNPQTGQIVLLTLPVGNSGFDGNYTVTLQIAANQPVAFGITLPGVDSAISIPPPVGGLSPRAARDGCSTSPPTRTRPP